MNEIWLLVVLGAALTYGIRIGGHLLLSRLETIPPRLEAALNAVPPAMLVTIVTPVFVEGGWLERTVIVLSAVVSMRLSVLATVTLAVLTVALLRAAGF